MNGNENSKIAYFDGLDSQGRPVFELPGKHLPTHQWDLEYLVVVDDFLDPDDSDATNAAIAEIIAGINTGVINLHSTGLTWGGEASHEVFDITAAFRTPPPATPKRKPDTTRVPLYDSFQLAAYVLEHGYTKYKNVSGKFKAETYLYKIVKHGRLLDGFSASAICSAFKQLDDIRRDKLRTIPIESLISLIFKIAK